EIDRSVIRRVSPTPVLVRPRAGVEWGRVHLLGAAIRRTADDDVPTALGRAALDPVDVVAVEHDLTQADRPGGGQLGGNRRLPGSVGGGLNHRRCLAAVFRWVSRAR